MDWEDKFWEFIDSDKYRVINREFVQELLELIGKVREEAVEEYKSIPMGVSQWREHGRKYHYDEYFGIKDQI